MDIYLSSRRKPGSYMQLNSVKDPDFRRDDNIHKKCAKHYLKTLHYVQSQFTIS